MNKSTSHLLSYLTRNNSWILAIVLTFISFYWVMTIVEYGSMVYIHQRKWTLFFQLLGKFILVFSPLIIFTIGRSFLKSKLTPSLNIVLWIVVFILYPLGIGFTSISEMLPVNMVSEMPTFIGLALAGVDLVSNPNTGLKVKSNLSKWINKISPEWIVILFYFIIAFQMSWQLEGMNGIEHRFTIILGSTLLLFAVYYLFYYINHYYLVSKIYKEKGLVYYIFSFLGLVTLFFIPVMLMYYYLPGLNKMIRLKAGDQWIGTDPPTFFSTIYIGTVTAWMYISIPLTIFIQWFKQSRDLSNLQKEKSDTELTMLKQQINPHFFFNTLNNVYSMSLQEDGRTSEAVLQLSDLMRYVIYKGKQDKVMLSEEVGYLKDFVELQKMRLLDTTEVSFSMDIQNEELEISPLLFIILVENGFKHGVENSEKEGYLSISISEKEGTVQLRCINSFEDTQINNEGLGLENLRKRLSLLYPGKSDLEITTKNGIFSAQLTIDTV